MMLVITASGSKYKISEEDAKKLQASIQANVKYVTLSGAMIAVSSIMEVKPESLDELPNGQWRCEHGHIHPAVDGYCGLGDLTKKPGLAASNPKTPEQEKEEHSRGRKAMDSIRGNLSRKLGWK